MGNQSNSYQILDDYCLRTPMFPLSFYKSVLKNSIPDFKLILGNPIFREALFLASPELYKQILKWEQGKIKDPKKIEKLQFSILKYGIRISNRCTPFGLLASCNAGNFDVETNIHLKKNNDYKRITCFDTTFLNQLLQELLKNKTIKKHILFYPNTSIYKIGNHFRYVEYKLEKKKRNYSLEGFNHSEFIETILKSAKNGKTIYELSSILVNENITTNEALTFIEELVENQILVSELEITVTGNDYFKNLLNRIKVIPDESKTYSKLFNLQKLITQLDTKIGHNIKIYQTINSEAKELIPELDSKYLFQTDTFTTFKSNTLNRNIKKQIQKAFVIFNKMTLPYVEKNIEQFKNDFLKRFEQSEVPLNLALDTETGIGFGSKKEDTNDLIDDFSLFRTKKRYDRIIWTDVDTILQTKLIKAIQKKQYSILLNENDFSEFSAIWDDLPDTFSSIIEIFKSKKENQIFIEEISGASATYLLGRFSSGDKKILSAINKIVNFEKTINSDKILAEIIHLPEARTGNILQRASFRKYEIPYLGKSSVTSKYQIPIEDILVSIKNDEIILRSKNLNKEILPRLGNAHNYGTNTLPIYQFLCEVQTQNKRSSIGFNWNKIFKNHPFLPRIEFENMIFSKARWRVNVKEFKNIFSNNNLRSSINKWQNESMIPDLIELVEGDNKLLINLKNDFSIKMLLEIIKNKKEFLLEEFLFSDDEIVKVNKNDSFCNQFVVSFYNEGKLNSTSS